MKNKKSIADYKAQARDNLLGNYGVAVGSFVLLFVLLYGLSSIIIGSYTSSSAATNAVSGNSGTTYMLFATASSYKEYIITTILSLIVGALSALFTTGYLYILREISYGRQARVGDVWFCFKNHPDKVIILFAITAITQVVALLPVDMMGIRYSQNMSFGNAEMMRMLISYVIGYGVYIFVYLFFALDYLIYLDDVEQDIKDIVICSIKLMKGNKFKFIGMYLSFLGYFVLGIISLGVGLLWVAPYQRMTLIEFYKDVKDED